MSFAHFLFHDFVHGIWHLDKGFFATLKKALIHPGQQVRAYLRGKRVGFFNILTMILLLMAFIGFVDNRAASSTTVYDETTQPVIDFLNRNGKWVLLGLSSVSSWSSALWFRKARLNLSEHTVANSFFLIGLLLIQLGASATQFWHAKTGSWPQLLMLFYVAYAYFGAFRADFSLAGWLWRFIAHLLFSTVLVMSLTLLAGLLLVPRTGNRDFKFDTIHTRQVPKMPTAPHGQPANTAPHPAGH